MTLSLGGGRWGWEIKTFENLLRTLMGSVNIVTRTGSASVIMDILRETC